MNRQNNTVLVACGLAVSILALPALAQVAPPPTGPTHEQPTYTPAPRPKPVATPEPTKPAPKESFGARKSSRTSDLGDLPTNVPYPKLAKPGPDGRILRLRQLPDIAAMRSNPNIGPKSVDAIMPVVYARRNRTELAVIDNLDLYWALSGGLIENMDMSDIHEMGRVADMLKPLVPDTTLSQDLTNRGLLSRVQGGMNQYIVREYKKAITDEIQVLDGDQGLQEVMRFVLEDSLQEARLAYEGMIAEASTEIADLVDKVGLDSTDAQALKKFQKPLSDDPAEQFLDLQDFDKAFRKLPYTDAIKILTAVRQARAFENIAPTIKKIDVLHDRKKVMEGDFGAKVVDPKTGQTLYDSKEHDEKLKERELKESGEQPAKEPGEQG